MTKNTVMPACQISYIKFLFVLAQLGASSCTWTSMKQNTLCYTVIVRLLLLFCSLV